MGYHTLVAGEGLERALETELRYPGLPARWDCSVAPPQVPLMPLSLFGLTNLVKLHSFSSYTSILGDV